MNNSRSKFKMITFTALYFIAAFPFIHTFKFPPDYQISHPPQNQDSCVVLESCKSLEQIWKTRHVMMNSLEVLLSLEEAFCGFLGYSDTPIFKCPEQPQSPPMGRFIADGHGFVEPCSGAVQLLAAGAPETQEAFYDSIEKMMIVSDRVIVTGNCCWRLHSRKKFHGRSLIVRAGATHSGLGTLGTVKSLKKLEECPF